LISNQNINIEPSASLKKILFWITHLIRFLQIYIMAINTDLSFSL